MQRKAEEKVTMRERERKRDGEMLLSFNVASSMILFYSPLLFGYDKYRHYNLASNLFQLNNVNIKWIK